MHTLYDTVAIVGPGLIGGSMGIAMRHRGVAEKVVGIGRRESSLQEAIDVGAVNETTLDLQEGVHDAELVVLATPIRVISRLMPDLSEALAHQAVITDVASTKRSVIDDIEHGLQDRPDVTLVPTHPMAGSEHRGAVYASEDLFENSVCIFTPPPDTPDSHVNNLKELWETLGATTHQMGAAEHDSIVAYISHLPHLAASCLIECITSREGTFAGGGFVDTTRVASGDPRLWRDICESNADEIQEALHNLALQIQTVEEMFAREDFDGIQQLLADAKEKRDDIIHTIGK